MPEELTNTQDNTKSGEKWVLPMTPHQAKYRAADVG